MLAVVGESLLCHYSHTALKGTWGCRLARSRGIALAGMCRDLGAHVQPCVQACRMSLGIYPGAWSQVGQGEGKGDPQVNMLAWWAGEPGLGMLEWAWLCGGVRSQAAHVL